MEKGPSSNTPLFSCARGETTIVCDQAPKAHSYQLTLATRSFEPRIKWKMWKSFTEPTPEFNLSKDILQKDELIKWVVTAHNKDGDAFARTFISSIGDNRLSPKNGKKPFFTITDPEPGETYRFEDNDRKKLVEFTWVFKRGDSKPQVALTSQDQLFLEIKKWRAKKPLKEHSFTLNSQNNDQEFTLRDELKQGRYRAQVVLKKMTPNGHTKRFTLSLPIAFSVTSDHLPIQKF